MDRSFRHELHLDSQLPPAEVLARLRGAVAAGPDAPGGAVALGRGLYGFRLRVDGRAFRASVRRFRLGTGPRRSPRVLVAEVRPVAGGSRIAGYFRPPRYQLVAQAVWFGLLVAAALAHLVVAPAAAPGAWLTRALGVVLAVGLTAAGGVAAFGYMLDGGAQDEADLRALVARAAGQDEPSTRHVRRG